jgi:hypothetical protein
MRIAVIGIRYAGPCLDKEEAKVAWLRRGEMPAKRSSS